MDAMWNKKQRIAFDDQDRNDPGHYLRAAVKSLEERPLADDVEIAETEHLWPALSTKPGLLSRETKDLIELAFDHGGFVAGGFARWAATSDRSLSARGAYITSGGDVDLFFRDAAGWQNYVRRLQELKTDSDETSPGMVSSLGLSPGRLAINILLTRRKHSIPQRDVHAFNCAPPFQAIGCAFGSPVQIMRSFDFVNCMFAIERDRSWSAVDARGLEIERTLGIAGWASRGLPFRIAKYRQKYGYLRARDLSGGHRVDHLLAATKRCADGDDADRTRSVRAWAQFLHETPKDFLEDPTAKLDIMSCTILPFDEATQHSAALAAGTAASFWMGNYESCLLGLRNREERAKLVTEEVYQSRLDALMRNRNRNDINALDEAIRMLDHPSWTADDYCWTF